MTDKEIGEYIKHRRNELGFSLSRVADFCGVNKSTVLRWESGDISQIKRYHISSLSKCLYIPIWILMGDDSGVGIAPSPDVVAEKEQIKDKVDSIDDLDSLKKIDQIIEAFRK